ncbi:MAG: glycosyltransferase family 4 protein [Sulfolobales archaeon]|nr:glycosyltransferase family 4 protein [Sulfolobales archaeon]
MKILFISPRYYPHGGGLEHVVKSVAKRLARQGRDVLVITGESDAPRLLEESVSGVQVIRWPVRSPGEAYYILVKRSELEKLIREEALKADVVHVHSVHTIFTVYVANAARRHANRLVLTSHYHGTGHTVLRRTLWVLWRRYAARTVRRADVVHAVSSYEAEILKKDFGVESVVIEHGVDEWVKSVEWKPEDYVLYSGHIERYKNIEKIARVVEVLGREYGMSYRLKISGDGPHKGRLIKYLERLDIEYEVTPFKPYSEYIEVLSRACLLANLSEREAFGLTVNEAHAIGVPVMVSKPWGRHFEKRPRTLVVDLGEGEKEVAREVVKFLEHVKHQPKPEIRGWNDAVELYIAKLYTSEPI